MVGWYQWWDSYIYHDPILIDMQEFKDALIRRFQPNLRWLKNHLRCWRRKLGIECNEDNFSTKLCQEIIREWPEKRISLRQINLSYINFFMRVRIKNRYIKNLVIDYLLYIYFSSISFSFIFLYFFLIHLISIVSPTANATRDVCVTGWSVILSGTWHVIVLQAGWSAWDQK